MIKKRGYSREFTPRTAARHRYLLDNIPPTLWNDAKRKADREGMSMRAILLTLLTAWTKATPGDDVVAVADDVATKTLLAGAAREGPVLMMLRENKRAIDSLCTQLDVVATTVGKATVRNRSQE